MNPIGHTPLFMVVEFFIVPLGKGVHFSETIAELVRIVVDSKLPHVLTAMGTIVEGDWEAVMKCIRRCHEHALTKSQRILTTIRIDDFPGRTGRITGKVEAVQKKVELA